MERLCGVRAAVIISALSLVLVGCSPVENTDSTGDTVGTAGAPTVTTVPCGRTPEQGAKEGPATVDKALDAHGLSDMDPVAERPTNMIASVRHDELLISTELDEVAFPLPSEQTYVSIAPYAAQTHECFYHSLTTCIGELGNEDIAITITDDTTGNLLVEENATAFDNGFIGFWLPAGAQGTIEVEPDGRTGATCVTTLQMA